MNTGLSILEEVMITIQELMEIDYDLYMSNHEYAFPGNVWEDIVYIIEDDEITNKEEELAPYHKEYSETDIQKDNWNQIYELLDQLH